MTGVFLWEKRDSVPETHTGDGGGDGTVQLQATEHQTLQAATRSQEEATSEFSLSSFQREQGLPTLTLDFQPRRLWGNKFLGFYITKSVVICYSRPRKLIHHLIITDDVALYLMTEKDVCDPLSNQREKINSYKHRLYLSLFGWPGLLWSFSRMYNSG